MKQWLRNQFNRYDNGIEEYGIANNGTGGGISLDSPGMLDGFSAGWQWDELAAEVAQESQACVVIAGLAGSGKSLLFNRLRGWSVSETGERAAYQQAAGADYNGLCLETFGAFLLADLPEEAGEVIGDGDALWVALGNPALVVYLLNGPSGVRQEDYRWISLLNAGGKPVVVALNQCDLLEDVETAVHEAQLRLGTRVIPISALSGENVESVLLPAVLNAAPKVAIALGREITQLRRLAAQRVIRHAALYTGILSVQPLPVLDVPLQIMVQVGVVMRVGAAYGRPPAGGINKEVLGVVAGSLTSNYLIQSVVKLIPILGWAVSGLMGAAATWLIGEAAILYYEGGVERAGQFAGDRLRFLSGPRQKIAARLSGLPGLRRIGAAE